MAFIESLKSTVMPRSLKKAACASDVGRKRNNNEDNFYFNGQFMSSDNHGTPKELTWERSLSIKNTGTFFAVFDGMGGGDYGEVASFTAAEATAAFFADERNMDPHDISISLVEYCKGLNEKVYRAGSSLGSWQMGSTLVAIYCLDGRFWVCNLGDSRCYLLRRNQIYQISQDHTDEAEMKANGITGRKPYLTQYLGINPQEVLIEPYVKSYEFEAEDLILLCSDGLTDMVPLEEIRKVLVGEKEPEDAVRILVSMALAAGGKDNITVMVCRV